MTGRSTKAGTVVPATHRRMAVQRSPSSSRPPLNEGRDRSPGDTRAPAALVAQTVRGHRSTKAGTVVPATPCTKRCSVARLRKMALNEGRDRSPGDTGGIIVAFVGGRQARSTKAGTVVPATRRRGHAASSKRRSTAQRRPGP